MISEKSKELLVCYYPYFNKLNQYNERNINAIGQLGATVVSLKGLIKKGGGFKKKVLIMNWVESLPVRKKGGLSPRGFIRLSFLVIAVIVARPNLVWVMHNYAPHNGRGLALRISRLLEKWLKSRSDACVVHSQELAKKLGYHFVPHPLYRDKLCEVPAVTNSEKLRFLFVGTISSYKGLKPLLCDWPREVGLDIYGKILDRAYCSEMTDLIKSRELDVNVFAGYLSEEALWEKMNSYFAMVLPHKEETSVVSGSYYLAKSAGMLILINAGEEDLGVVSYGDKQSLDSAVVRVLDLAKKNDREFIFEDALQKNGLNQVAKQWDAVFQGLNTALTE